LFPNGYYFTLAGFTGYVNLFHLKPSLTVKPASNLSVMGALGFQWRETTADAIYVQPNIPVAGTAGKGSAWSGAYAQLRMDYRFDAHLADIARYQDFINRKLYDLLLMAQATAKANNHIAIEPHGRRPRTH
jgi:hypothetical protein